MGEQVCVEYCAPTPVPPPVPVPVPTPTPVCCRYEIVCNSHRNRKLEGKKGDGKDGMVVGKKDGKKGGKYDDYYYDDYYYDDNYYDDYYYDDGACEQICVEYCDGNIAGPPPPTPPVGPSSNDVTSVCCEYKKNCDTTGKYGERRLLEDEVFDELSVKGRKLDDNCEYECISWCNV